MPGHSRRILVARQAEVDILEAYYFTAERWGEEQATLYRARILNAFDLLANNPEIGKRGDGSLASFRMFPIERHGIWYRLGDDELSVARVIDLRRHVTNSLLSEDPE